MVALPPVERALPPQRGRRRARPRLVGDVRAAGRLRRLARADRRGLRPARRHVAPRLGLRVEHARPRTPRRDEPRPRPPSSGGSSSTRTAPRSSFRPAQSSISAGSRRAGWPTAQPPCCGSRSRAAGSSSTPAATSSPPAAPTSSPSTGLPERGSPLDEGEAAATSSWRQRSWRNGDGRIAHHLIDPATGAPGAQTSATVVGTSATEADVLATDPRAAARWLADLGTPARVEHDGFRRANPAWAALAGSATRMTNP